jgi:uncharacterized protein YlaI
MQRAGKSFLLNNKSAIPDKTFLSNKCAARTSGKTKRRQAHGDIHQSFESERQEEKSVIELKVRKLRRLFANVADCFAWKQFEDCACSSRGG